MKSTIARTARTPGKKPAASAAGNPQSAIRNPQSPETVHQLALALCHVSERNTRQPAAKDPGMDELVLSIKTTGQTTPAIVRPHPKRKGHYEIAAGARRRVACELAGAPTLAAVIRTLDDNAFEELILVENLQRVDPDPAAEIELLDRLAKRGIHTAAQISAHLGKPEHWAERRLQVLKVIPELRKLWGQNSSYGLNHFTVEMMSLVGSLPAETQKMFTDRDAWRFRRCTSRPELQRYLNQEVLCRLKDAPFDLNDPRTFVPGCGPGCFSDSSLVAHLFDMGDKKEKDCARCLNTGCFFKRAAIARKIQFDELTKGEELPIITLDCNAPRSIAIGDKTVAVESLSYQGYGNHPETKETPGAKKVLHVDAQGKLSIGYLPKRSSGGGSGPARDVKTPAQKMAEKKALLQSRRWDIVRRALIDAIMASSAGDLTVEPEELIPVFGFGYRQSPLCHRGRNGANELWALFDSRKSKGYACESNPEKINYLALESNGVGSMRNANPTVIKDRRDALWHGLKTVMVNQLLGTARVSDIVADHVTVDIERVGKLINFPVVAKKREADLQILPPRSWGKVDPHTLEPITVAQQLKAARKLGESAKLHWLRKLEPGKSVVFNANGVCEKPAVLVLPFPKSTRVTVQLQVARCARGYVTGYDIQKHGTGVGDGGCSGLPSTGRAALYFPTVRAALVHEAKHALSELRKHQAAASARKLMGQYLAEIRAMEIDGEPFVGSQEKRAAARKESAAKKSRAVAKEQRAVNREVAKIKARSASKKASRK